MFYFASQSIFIPDESGDLVALNQPEQILQEMPPGDFGAAFVKMILSLIALVALLALTVWFLRRLIQGRLEKGSTNQSIQVLEKRMISPKTMLYLIEADGKKILVAESHLEIVKLQELPNGHSVD